MISEEYVGGSGVKYIFEYTETDSFDALDNKKCKQAYGICFCEDKMVIGFGGQKKGWGLIGGTIEKGESFEQTLRREIIEESNMEILSFLPLGYQKALDTRDGSYVYQLRYVCKVRPIAPFTSDPAGGISEIKLIHPTEYKDYFNWGKIGERIMNKALKLKDRL